MFSQGPTPESTNVMAVPKINCHKLTHWEKRNGYRWYGNKPHFGWKVMTGKQFITINDVALQNARIPRGVYHTLS